MVKYYGSHNLATLVTEIEIGQHSVHSMYLMNEESNKCMDACYIIYSFMGRSVIDLPPKVIHECVSVNENCLHWDKYAVVSDM